MDTRELILDRLLTVAAGVAGVRKVARNQQEIADSELPAILIFDADEGADDRDPTSRPSIAYRRVAMMPEVRIMIGARSSDVGAGINALRAAFIKAVLTDDTLIGLTAERSGPRYEGCATQLKIGRSMQGDMLVMLRFAYYLKPSQL